MKKSLIPLSLFAAMTLGACSLINAQNATETKGVVANLDSTEMSYAFAGVSSLRLLKEGEIEESSEEETPVEENVSEESSIDMDTANRYLAMYNELTSEDNFSISEVESDKEDYVYEAVIKAKSDVEEAKEYKLYFNEVVVEEANDEEVEENPHHHGHEDDVPSESEEEAQVEEESSVDGESEDVIEAEEATVEEARKSRHHGHKHEGEDTILSGLLVDGESEYEIKGSRHNGKHGVVTKFSTKLDEETKISFSQSLSDKVTSYSYCLKKNHRVVSEYTLTNVTDSDYNEFSFEKYADNKYSVYYFSSFVVDEQEYFEILYYEDNVEFGYVYAKVNYDADGNKSVDYLYSESEILEEDDFWGDDENDYYWEEQEDFEEHDHHGEDHGHHEGHSEYDGHDYGSEESEESSEDYGYDEEDFDFGFGGRH